MIRGFAYAFVLSLAFWLTLFALIRVASAQTQRVTCYYAGNVRICDTYDAMGNWISKSRCYPSGRAVHCDVDAPTTMTPIPVPLDRRP